MFPGQTGIFKQEPKERLCQVGAAEMSCPGVSFLARVGITWVYLFKRRVSLPEELTSQ